MEYRSMISKEYSIREAHEDDFGKIAGFFRRHDHVAGDEQFLRRKYLANPAGKGRIFLMEDLNKEIKGTVGYVPQVLYSHRKYPVKVMESVDLFLAPEARGKKMFPEFQGRAMKMIGQPLIAFPTKRAEDITVQLGWERFAPIMTWVFPIGPGLSPEKKRRGVLLLVFRAVLKAYASLWSSGGDYRIELKSVERFEHPFGQCMRPLRMGRTPDYLNWRYVGNPSHAYGLYEFHLDGDVVGYCVVSTEDTALVIYDLFSTCDEGGCVQALAKHFVRDDSLEWLAFRGVGLRLWRLGFVRGYSKTNLITHNLPKEPWVLTLGDSDW